MLAETSPYRRRGRRWKGTFTTVRRASGAARERTTSSASALASSAVTVQPRASRASVSFPEPLPRSSAPPRTPGRACSSARSSRGLGVSCLTDLRAYSPQWSPPVMPQRRRVRAAG
nr:hypothetical protein [Deinococcus sp.]